MLSGAIDAMSTLQPAVEAAAGQAVSVLRPIVLGVSGGAIAAAAAAIGMPAAHMRELAVRFPGEQVLGRSNVRSLIARRTLYPAADIRTVARAVVADRSFADFALSDAPGERSVHTGRSSLIITVFSARWGTLFLPQDLWRLGLDDMLVADALVAATRIPGVLPPAPGLDDLFDGAIHHRVPYEVFLPHHALVLDLYGPRPYRSLGGLALPAVHPGLPPIPFRPRPFRDPAVRERTIFANLPYGSSLKSPVRQPGTLFDLGRRLATRWMAARNIDELSRLLGLPTFDRRPAHIARPDRPNPAQADGLLQHWRSEITR
ncbi:patatin-like phospholipase family protein [Nocardia aurantia]|uniref:patatin-like phospholipase family protein n=1 Tax=Nocardia aurantia TaxID=2585199 RepID=UPI00129688BC|nr:patatin-like phospholipase family protein [Nocardia aurantia]